MIYCYLFIIIIYYLFAQFILIFKHRIGNNKITITYMHKELNEKLESLTFSLHFHIECNSYCLLLPIIAKNIIG